MILFDHPLRLILLPLLALPALIPLLAQLARPTPTTAPTTGPAPQRGVEALLRLLGLLALAALILGLAGPRIPGGQLARLSTGADLVLLIDRSQSMDDSFAGRRPDADADGGNEAKSLAARRLLTDFVTARQGDRIAVAGFSTAPMLMLPMTDRQEAVLAAIAATGEPGLAKTDVGRGLALAFSLFTNETGAAGTRASRAVILVSDGAGLIPRAVQDQLRTEARRLQTNLYWLYLRTRNAKGIFDPPAPGEADTAMARPERHLHLFLNRLGIPYRAFEAESPEDVARAIEAIDRLESRPVVIRETLPGRSLAGACWITALAASLLLLAAKCAEIPPPAPPRGPWIRGA